MKSLLASSAMFLMVGLLAAAQAGDGWVKVTAKNDKFTVLFPARPFSVDSLYLLNREPEKAKLVFTSDDFVLDIKNEAVVKNYLDVNREASKTAGKILAEKISRLNGKYPMIDWDLEDKNVQGGVRRVRQILTGVKKYELSIQGPADYLKGAEAKKFIESIKVTD